MTRRRSYLATQDAPDLEEDAAAERAPQPLSPDEDEIEDGVPTDAEPGPNDAFWPDAGEEGAMRRPEAWIVPSLAVLALAGWTGFFGWTYHADMIGGAPAQQWAQWLSTWAVPAVLILATWLLLRRNGPREAHAFAAAARTLADESHALEARLKTVNRELSLARDFIASQSRDLEALGRQATTRLGDSAEYLQSLIQTNSGQLDNIASIGESAVANMENLRDNLPVLANAARDLSSQIGNAGHTANTQLEALVAEFDRLSHFNEMGNQQIALIDETVSATLASFESEVKQLGEAVQARFGKFREVSESFRTDMAAIEDTAFHSIQSRADTLEAALAARHAEQSRHEDAALTNLQERLSALSTQGEGLIGSLAEGRESMSVSWNAAINALEDQLNTVISRVSEVDEAAMGSAQRRLDAIHDTAISTDSQIAESLAAFDQEMVRRRSESAARQADELSALEARLDAFDAAILAKREGFASRLSQLTERSDTLLERLDTIENNITALNQAGDAAENQLGSAADDFAARLGQSRAVLEDNGTRIEQLTADSARLLEIIRSSADHSSGTLASAIHDAETRLASFGEEANRIGALIGEAEASSSRLENHVGQASASGQNACDHLSALESDIARISHQAEVLAEHTRTELRSSIETLSVSAIEALDRFNSSKNELVAELAETIASESREKVAQVILADASRAIAELDEAVEHSAARGQQTAQTLRDQMALLNELAGNLEQRIAYARERAEERIDSDFSCRLALITESLNSSAIDIAKAFDNEVSDTQWASYLKGDRGIFTRRSVQLLDRGQSRAIAEVYEEDSEFRETVNRFIHDFEAMLREVLATRDGNALAVTLLSSDTGKLYVALAQAIERLRN